MNNEDQELTLQYREAVRLHLWYTGSKFSFHQGKTSKELAQRYLSLSHAFLKEISDNKRKS